MTNPAFVGNLDEISKAFSQGNADALGQYFDQSVAISIMDDENFYKKAEAVTVMKSFFAQHSPKTFTPVHQGASKGADAQYCIGNLVAGATTFRVYLYMKVSGGVYTIQEIRVDKQ